MYTHSTRYSLLSCLVLASALIGVNVVAALDMGAQAPDFTLPSTTGTPISLSQFKGKNHVLLQFYSLDFNPT
jgi:cytochrome oxidase Cu insertion factor (SCO1/SenC/PrrC family)